LKEAQIRLIGCDLHASQQSIAMLDRDTGAVIESEAGQTSEAPFTPTKDDCRERSAAEVGPARGEKTRSNPSLRHE